jgi:predicted alpha/beta hydrolase
MIGSRLYWAAALGYGVSVPETVQIRARDGHPLEGDLFQPPGTPRAAVLVASAMGVPRSYYAPFATYLARQGLAALTVDYRGIGGSRAGPLRGSPATLRDWGERDLGGAADLLAARVPGVPLLWVGHSVGGQLLGLLDDVPLAGALLVGAQSGYWRLWSGGWRWRIFLLWHALIPMLVPALGRLPSFVFGGGEDIPPGVAREWAAWGRRRDYLMSYAGPLGGRGFAQLSAPVVSYAIADDSFAPRASVEALLGFYAKAPTELRVVDPAALGVRHVGHFGFFRARFEPTLWRDAALFLVRAADGAGPGQRAGTPPPRRARP